MRYAMMRFPIDRSNQKHIKTVNTDYDVLSSLWGAVDDEEQGWSSSTSIGSGDDTATATEPGTSGATGTDKKDKEYREDKEGQQEQKEGGISPFPPGPNLSNPLWDRLGPSNTETPSRIRREGEEEGEGDAIELVKVEGEIDEIEVELEVGIMDSRGKVVAEGKNHKPFGDNENDIVEEQPQSQPKASDVLITTSTDHNGWTKEWDHDSDTAFFVHEAKVRF